ncbi:hypothetical protein A3H89_00335 [Candidatus Amesbacteria bacterium RIFCSPLOWO2_02_FULL_48_11]|uniref:PIN domain-containing protein n=4 Tax=Candidatus Amesiibacteriota TaxID=1752730 RepID=A0A1F4Z903_9BACT|nr:MAG: hypothetical protein UX78_C0005G0065 [Candidatus Amesbacteria bacterium GW2011_GWA2_47_11]KKU93757.1 MAG: hypothetical protein UY22_C0017G0014 [Candidatus Amesbacteria bacterium GW2011_GWC1_48_10]KKU99551.1 MAG: hypothetical protein UY33_C0028G0005 [Candidatus Amesbacteria bacterium GW2011_GWA1_48_9]OGC90003.1 MAG: hypothetical protein A2V48_01180 [Candidatus Amesbacteria bacterium RBG_19FT_COMBO_48_16]OGC96210.1 MAG: hypothetical protein A3C34_02390 [Candidatus Amesbacteria bacterium R
MIRRLLVDADWLVGAFRDEDAHHQMAAKSVARHEEREDELYVLNLVLQETGTVLSHRTGMRAVRLFWEKLPKLGLKKIGLDEELEDEVWRVFLKQTKKGCSFVDCANLVVMGKYKLDGILTWDEFYPKDIRVR